MSLPRQVRLVLENQPDALPLSELLALVDRFVAEYTASSEPELLFQLEDELQTIHHEVVNHSSLSQTELFLAVLFHLCPVLPSTSIISTWFDLVLRPALREAKLPTPAVNHAKELIISALQKVDSKYQEKVGEFRRHLLDLYLLDAFNEGSGDDVLEWAELDQKQKEKRTRWKSNLEDILLKFGIDQPQALLTEIHSCFSTPSSRIQLLMFLNSYTSQPSFPAAVLARHPIMSTLVLCLLLDNSSTVCTIGLALLVKLFPLLAVQAGEDLKRMLPQLLAILARIICWRERPPSNDSHDSTVLDDDDIPTGTEFSQDLEGDSGRIFHLRPDLVWQQLGAAFYTTASSAPSPRPYFTFLYYLFPCNVLNFLRNPSVYLNTHRFESPYTEKWEEVLDEDEIRSRAETLLRGHICHPLVIWRGADAELAEPDFWAQYDVARIASESKMLDCRSAALAIRERHPDLFVEPEEQRSSRSGRTSPNEAEGQPPPMAKLTSLSPASRKPSISLSEMITTSITLKSTLDLDIQGPNSGWPSGLFSESTASSSRSSLQPPSVSSQQPEGDQVPSRVAEAISALQREVLLLRTELNFELWISRENVKHFGRLYQDRILSKNAEAERQGLYNKLRRYRGQVVRLERELREHKEQASSAKNKYADWNTELQQKLRDFREEKKSWISEAATLRNAEKEARALFTAQGKLLAGATKELTQLQTQKKENQHKIDRLRDYERQIDQFIKTQRLWDEDFRKFNERADQLEHMTSEYRKMELRLHSLEETITEANDSARGYRRQIASLEARLAATQRKASDGSRRMPAAEIAAFSAEKAIMAQSNRQLREDNADLRDEVEEMKAMIELLKAQVSGRKGLVSDPRASPRLSPSSLTSSMRLERLE